MHAQARVQQQVLARLEIGCADKTPYFPIPLRLLPRLIDLAFDSYSPFYHLPPVDELINAHEQHKRMVGGPPSKRTRPNSVDDVIMQEHPSSAKQQGRGNNRNKGMMLTLQEVRARL